MQLTVALRTLYNLIEKGWLEAKYHQLIYPHYKKTKKLRKRNPKHALGISIEERPDYINNRSENGHYEIDTVLLTKSKGSVLIDIDR